MNSKRFDLGAQQMHRDKANDKENGVRWSGMEDVKLTIWKKSLDAIRKTGRGVFPLIVCMFNEWVVFHALGTVTACIPAELYEGVTMCIRHSEHSTWGLYNFYQKRMHAVDKILPG